MVIDTSAIIAILFGEPEAETFAALIERHTTRLVSTATFLETGIVIESELGEQGMREFDLFRLRSELEAVPFTEEHLRLAQYAFRTFGKGRHPAALNFGDCFSYALSKGTGEPLLFKGNDFPRTDVDRAI